MKIQIDTDVLLKNDITLDEYFILYCIYNKEYNLLFLIYNCSESVNLLNDLLKGLEIKQFLKNTKGIVNQIGDLTLVYLKAKGNDLFEEDLDNPEKLFLEFWNLYPLKVPDGKGSYRILRSKDSETKQANELKKKYFILIKQAGTHTKIIKGLTGYLSNMRNKMQFIVGIEVFINQALWEKYLDEDIVDSKTANYGEDI
jgi:hypothetical protein